MFWKIFAWVNLIINLPLLIITITSGLSVLQLIDIIVILFNNLPMLVIPLLFAHKIYYVRCLSSAILLKTILVFTILYNTTQIVNDLIKYNFTTIPGFLFDMFFYILIILSIISFVLYIMNKYKISFFGLFTK